MLVTSCGNYDQHAKLLAKKLKAKFTPLEISSFPDGDLYLKFSTPLKGKHLLIYQSFYPHPDTSLFDVLMAAHTARDLGAKKITLVVPYLSYMRQDIRFHPGEAITSKVMGTLLSNCIDRVVTVDPHLHRYSSLREVFRCKSKVLTANLLIAQWIKAKIKEPVIIGPDAESYQWAESIASTLGAPVTVLRKQRISSHKVKISVPKLDLSGRNVVIVDDVISTGHTVADTAKLAGRQKPKSITAIGVHGLFVDSGYERLKKAGVTRIVTTNSVRHTSNKIDIIPLLARHI